MENRNNLKAVFLIGLMWSWFIVPMHQTNGNLRPVDRVFLNACKNDKSIDFALKQGANIRAIDPDTGYTGLHYACKNGNWEMVSRLIDENVLVLFVEASDGYNHISAIKNSKNEKLIKDVQGKLDRRLINACSTPGPIDSFTAEINKLLRLGANINAANEKGLRGLELSARNMKRVEFLLSKGAVIDDKTKMVFGYALLNACNDSTVLVDVFCDLVLNLTKLGADINFEDEAGFTPLFYMCGSADKDRIAKAKILLQCGADIDYISQKIKATLLYSLIATTTVNKPEFNGPEMIRFLIENKADVNITGPGKHSVLQAVVLANNTECINIILDANPDIHNVDSVGHSVLRELVCGYKKDDALQLLQRLLNMGCLPQINKSGLSLMHCAAIRGDLDIIDELVKHGVGLNDKDHEDGQTCLHYAAEYSGAQVVQKLLACGAKQIKDKHGKTPLHVSRQNKKHDKKAIEFVLKNAPSPVKIATIVVPMVAAELTIETEEIKKKKSLLGIPKKSKKKKTKVKEVVLPKELKETIDLNVNKPVQENILSSEKVELSKEKSDDEVSLKKPKKTLIEKAQSFVVKAITGSSSQEMVAKTYAAAVNLGQEEKAPQKRLYTFQDDHLNISVSSEIYPKLLADHKTNPLAAVTNHSDQVLIKMADPDDHFHNFSTEIEERFGQFACIEKKGDATMYAIPAQVTLPWGSAFQGMFEFFVKKDKKTGEDIMTHRFFNPDKNGKNIPLLLSASK